MDNTPCCNQSYRPGQNSSSPQPACAPPRPQALKHTWRTALRLSFLAHSRVSPTHIARLAHALGPASPAIAAAAPTPSPRMQTFPDAHPPTVAIRYLRCRCYHSSVTLLQLGPRLAANGRHPRTTAEAPAAAEPRCCRCFDRSSKYASVAAAILLHSWPPVDTARRSPCCPLRCFFPDAAPAQALPSSSPCGWPPAACQGCPPTRGPVPLK